MSSPESPLPPESSPHARSPAGTWEGGREAAGSVLPAGPASATSGAATVLEAECPTVAVIGNPNAGKTTIFNRLTGLRQKVANYPGVTIEKKVGLLSRGDVRLRFVDLPGTYSLAAHSPDEMIAVDVLLGHVPGEPRPDVVLHVVDATNLERNLYLLSQLRELGVPVVIALNMSDAARRRGIDIDAGELSKRLDTPVVVTEGHRGAGLGDLVRAIDETLGRRRVEPVDSASKLVELPPRLREEIDRVREETGPDIRRANGRDLHPFEILRILVDSSGHAEHRFVERFGEASRHSFEAARERLRGPVPLSSLEVQARYAWIRRQIDGVVRRAKPEGPGASERVDRVLLHPVLGPAVFLGLMVLIFQSIFTWAVPLMDLVSGAFDALGAAVGSWLPQGALRSLIVDGVIAGAGGVVVFLPQILILFLFIGLLEDCGYMARAAFLMDKVMSKCGLSGKSFIPMVSGFACAVPGIMAARVIENRRDRLATILVTPLMSCSARLPVYTILITAFIPDRPVLGDWLGLRAATMLGLYLLGIIVAAGVAWVLKRTLLRGETPPFVLELPDYRVPALPSVLLRLYDRGRAFVVRAGTIILAISILVWALAYYPRPDSVTAPFEERREAVQAELVEAASPSPEMSDRAEARLAAIDRDEAGALLRQSWFGRAGRAVAPVFEPLGWDWKISMAAIASFPAREVVVATLGTIYNLGGQVDAESPELGARLKEETYPGTGRKVFTVPVAISILVFFALCCQCGATIATIRRETNSWGWAWFTFAYMTGLAWVGAFAAYQLGSAL